MMALALSGCSGMSKTAAAPAAAPPIAATPPPAPAPYVAAAVVAAPAPEVVVISDVNFEFNKATLTPRAEKILDETANLLLRQPNARYQVNGYTDNTGSVAYNQGLSERRAKAVRDYQVSRGVPASQLITRGLGESDPVATNTTRDGRALNRRVEMRLIR
jgi:OOP family OmpA-OmpF porin